MADETVYNGLDLDEIVFENRNKEYGAYDLRRTYPKMLTKAMVIGTLLFLGLVVTPFVVMKIKQMNAPEKTKIEANLVEILEEEVVIDEPEEAAPPPPPPPKEEPVQQEVIQNVVPEPKQAPKVETPPPPISKQLETTTGLVNQEGVKTPSYTPPPPLPNTGNKVSSVEVKPSVSTTEVYSEVEQMAEYPGGINAFRNAVSSNFDTSVMDGDEGMVKAEVTFVVERDGSITQVKATGPNSAFNKEAERTVKGIKKKWAAAKINGQNVRYKFRMPLVMQFE